ncbi:competence protein CoiA family protein [Streptomyces sp. NPDC007157]|uniref:competence protein CoiA family protein n=1 Tax=Streptomyces sp. NPDC007157 TaxID=3154681 RepID=UPI00340F87D4
MEAIELDDFRARHTGQTYWCGTWLNGCGHQLFTKLYTDRACHFAHRPDPEHTSSCARKAAGVSSADHLYIKHGLLAWMAEQDVAVTATIPREADGSIGGEVLFAPAGHAGLRVLLSEAGSPAPGEEDSAHLVLGPEMASDPDVLLRQGYVNRIQLVPDGTRRRIQVGTERHGGATEWFDLHEVGFTDAGLTTPAVEEVRRLRTTRRPIGVQTPKAAPRPRPTVRATGDETHGVPSPDRADVMTALEQAISDGRSRAEIRRWLNRAEEVTHGGSTAEENTLIRAAADALLRLERAVGVPTPREPSFRERKALQKVQRLLGNFAVQKRHGFTMVTPQQRRQLAQAAEQASAWLTDAQRSQVHEWQTAPTESAPAPRAPQSPVPARTPRIPPAGSRSARFDAAGLAEAVRDVLEHAARIGKTVTFADLCAQVKDLGELPESEQVQVLRRVKPTARPRSAKPQRPALLTALITTEAGTMHPIYRRLADHAGHHLPQQADNAWTDTVNILHDRYRNP